MSKKMSEETKNDSNSSTDGKPSELGHRIETFLKALEEKKEMSENIIKRARDSCNEKIRPQELKIATINKLHRFMRYYYENLDERSRYWKKIHELWERFIFSSETNNAITEFLKACAGKDGIYYRETILNPGLDSLIKTLKPEEEKLDLYKKIKAQAEALLTNFPVDDFKKPTDLDMPESKDAIKSEGIEYIEHLLNLQKLFRLANETCKSKSTEIFSICKLDVLNKTIPGAKMACEKRQKYHEFCVDLIQAVEKKDSGFIERNSKNISQFCDYFQLKEPRIKKLEELSTVPWLSQWDEIKKAQDACIEHELKMKTDKRVSLFKQIEDQIDEIYKARQSNTPEKIDEEIDSFLNSKPPRSLSEESPPTKEALIPLAPNSSSHGNAYSFVSNLSTHLKEEKEKNKKITLNTEQLPTSVMDNSPGMT